ncbi:ubiquitin-conjugating enzyme E2 G1 [Pancytospora philotis]|nr:ubiquitin-conjugating enzyme E2 G1 [Pancytospora philotis]
MPGADGSRSKAQAMKDYRRITQDAGLNGDFSIGLINNNVCTWEVVIIGPKDTPYESGIYRAEMIFPLDYPDAPPTFRFVTPMWHPNIDKEGNVCISILHKPGDDEFGYELLSERWLPVRTPESVIISIRALLNSPNIESPFNIEAAQQFRNEPGEYIKVVRRFARQSLEM